MIEEMLVMALDGEATGELKARMKFAGFELKQDNGYFVSYVTEVPCSVGKGKKDIRLSLEITVDIDHVSVDALVGVGDRDGPIYAEIIKDEKGSLLYWLLEVGADGRHIDRMTPQQQKLYQTIQNYPHSFKALMDKMKGLQKWLTISLEPKTDVIH